MTRTDRVLPFVLCLTFLGASNCSLATSALAPSVAAVVTADCKFNFSGDDATDVLTLQRARLRIKDRREGRTAIDRSECGLNAARIVQAFFDCGACQSEITGLLKDAALMQRESAVEYESDPTNEAEFLANEIEVRTTLNSYLSQQLARPDSTFVERRSNLAALADAHERAKLGLEFHQIATVQSSKGVLGEASFAIWARAVRSCSNWDFDSGKNRLSPRVLKAAICIDACAGEYEKLDRAIEKSGDISIRATVDSFLPSKLCRGATPL